MPQEDNRCRPLSPNILPKKTKKGQIELESFIVTKKGRAGMDDDVVLDVC